MKKHKMEGWSAADARDVLDQAVETLEPDSLSQRQAFGLLMPQLRKMREKTNISFAQISASLAKYNFNLEPSTVRDYYRQEMTLLQKQNGEA